MSLEEKGDATRRQHQNAAPVEAGCRPQQEGGLAGTPSPQGSATPTATSGSGLPGRERLKAYTKFSFPGNWLGRTRAGPRSLGSMIFSPRPSGGVGGQLWGCRGRLAGGALNRLYESIFYRYDKVPEAENIVKKRGSQCGD